MARRKGQEPAIGDNSVSTSFSADQIQSIVARVERLEAEKQTISDDIKDIYAEAKGNGFDVKALREIVRIRKQDADKRAEHEAMVDLYMHSLGMLADLPLGQSAIARDLAPASVSTVNRPF